MFLMLLGTIMYSYAGDGLPRDISDFFSSAQVFTLYSLEPALAGKSSRKDVEKFRHWSVLGKTSSLDQRERRDLEEALTRGNQENQGEVAACFNPRHGIHLQRAKESVDLVICFECAQVEVFKDGKKVSNFLTTASPAVVFNRILRAKGIPLANTSNN